MELSTIEQKLLKSPMSQEIEKKLEKGMIFPAVPEVAVPKRAEACEIWSSFLSQKMDKLTKESEKLSKSISVLREISKGDEKSFYLLEGIGMKGKKERITDMQSQGWRTAKNIMKAISQLQFVRRKWDYLVEVVEYIESICGEQENVNDLVSCHWLIELYTLMLAQAIRILPTSEVNELKALCQQLVMERKIVYGFEKLRIEQDSQKNLYVLYDDFEVPYSDLQGVLDIYKLKRVIDDKNIPVDKLIEFSEKFREKGYLTGSEEIMTTRDAAKYLKLHPHILTNRARAGEMPAYKEGNRWRFKRKDIDKWIEQKMSYSNRGLMPTKSPRTIRQENLDKKIMELLSAKGEISTGELAEVVDYSKSSIENKFNKLIEDDILERIGTGPTTRYILKHPS